MTDFETHPDRYVHWKLAFDSPGGAIARLTMGVVEERPHRPGYRLKLNSYDLGVDIELADAIQRLRFEHPEVKCVVVSSALGNIFCAGANIMMLASSTHPFKVNFCKYTNDTRCSIEDASTFSGLHFICAANGTASGGGYELALACDEIVLVDDGNSAVSLPEVPLLGVLPGTGGLTRLVDKRKVRRDLADMFSTLAEGCKAKKALEWKLVDGSFTRSKFDAGVAERARQAVLKAKPKGGAKREGAQPPPQQAERSVASEDSSGVSGGESPPIAEAKGIRLNPIGPKATDDGFEYKHVSLSLERAQRVATLTVRGPESGPPASVAAVHEQGSELWALRAMRELDDALCRLRFDHEEIGLVLVKTVGDIDRCVAWSEFLAKNREDWLINEIIRLNARVLRRVDGMAKSLFAIVEPGSCFGGELLEIALACDRIYMLNDSKRPVHFAIGALSDGTLNMQNGLSRLQSRFLAEPARAEKLARERGKLDTDAAMSAGLVTVAPDEIDWDDDVRLAIEERVSLSPDALTGMEASLRFGGPESMDSKIYGRLSAWQNWIFTRPNATGETGALKLYGQPDRPKFDWRRT